jgi:hypothetical protein
MTPSLLSGLFVAHQTAGFVEIRPAGRAGSGLD